jgi:molybdate transport system substrate-binding protein
VARRKPAGRSGTAFPEWSIQRNPLTILIKARPARAAPWQPRSTAMFGRHFLISFVLFGTLSAAPALAQDRPITVFAAASMKNALDDVNAAFTKATKVKVTASYAASSTLMKQIEQGAPANVFVSADLDWMDYAAGKKLIRDDTRVNLLGNRLVLIAPKDSKLANITIGPNFNLGALAGEGRVAVGDVQAVPAGKYAKAALEKLGAWAGVSSKLAMTESVRAALALVARGEAVFGIVYETDAKAEPNVKIVDAFPADSHPAIVYPVALTSDARAAAAPYLAFLRTQVAKDVFERYGFTSLIRPTS